MTTEHDTEGAAVRERHESPLTRAVLDRLHSADARTQQISEALVRHLHAFVAEVAPTFDEWLAGIQFLTRTGQMCSDARQEFILLSDALGVSMLVDEINHRDAVPSTESTILGPFYRDSASESALGADLSVGAPGMKMLVRGTVRGADGTALPDTLLEVWQADGEGYYDVQRSDQPALRARFRTDGEGRFWFWSLVPSSYPIPDDGPVGDMLKSQGRHPYRPAHVHFKLSAPGYAQLITHIFIAQDKYLDSDVVFGVKESLIATLSYSEVSATDGTPLPTGTRYAILHYDFILAPES